MKILPLLLLIVVFMSFMAYAGNDTVDIILTKNLHFKGKMNKVELANDDGIKIKHKYSSFDGFSATVTREEYEKLKNDSRYNVETNLKKFHLTLDNSVPQIKANYTWKLQSNSTNITGITQTVCIIDTGVNYSHAAFGNCYGNNDPSSNCTVIGGWDFFNESGGQDNDPMDELGHGSHVSGIVASQDSTYKGVAPGAKIIMIKIFNSNDGGYNSDLLAGIDWCVNNATTFNISVISMSLSDCSAHNTYCDGDNPSLTSAINAATAKNISVIAAAGNGPFGGCVGQSFNSTSGPGSPACIENSTAIGGVNISDLIYPNFQRGNLFELFAPGYLITSVNMAGGFSLNSGTSMATPHVAGVVALLQQYAKMRNGNLKTPSQIEVILNNTGLRINDTSGTLLNYSRVNVYSAILSIDSTGPLVNLTSPSNTLVTSENSQNFSCNSSDWQLANTTLYLWNNTGLYYNETKNLTGTVNSTNFSLSNLASTTYYWNCKSYDLNGNWAFSIQNYTLTTGGVLMELNSPLNNNKTNLSNNEYLCNATSEGSGIISNISLYIWHANGTLVNISTSSYSGIENTSNKSYNFSLEGDYYWNCYGVNNKSNYSFAVTNYSISYDSTKPIISSLSEDPTSNKVTITWNTNEEASSVVLGDIAFSNSSYSLDHSVVINGLLASTNYGFYVRSCDSYGNCQASDPETFTTDASSSGGGGGGGGGGSSNDKTNKVIIVSESILKNGFEKGLFEGSRMDFNISEIKHSVTLVSIFPDHVKLLVQSEPMYIDLKQGEEKKLNLSSSKYYDSIVKVISIGGNAAEIFLKEIREEINPISNNTLADSGIKDDGKDRVNLMDGEGPNSESYLFWIVVVICLVIGYTVINKLFLSKRLKKIKPYNVVRKRRKNGKK